MALIDSALAYVADGFAVFPCKLNKQPLTEHGLKDATQLQARVKEYWTKFPSAGIGLVTDGLVVVDFDYKSGGLESKEKIEDKYGLLPRTRTHITGGGGFHYIYRNPNGSNIRNATALGGYPGVDLRANGGYIIAPPSHHASGMDYSVLDDSPIAPAPDWVVKMATLKPVSTGDSPPTDSPIPEGQRNATLTKIAGAMRRQGCSVVEIETALKVANQRCRPDPLPDYEVHAIARSVSTYPPLPLPPSLASHPSSPPPGDPGGGVGMGYSLSTSQPVSKRDKSVTGSVTERDRLPLSEKIEEWVLQTTGWFSYEDCDKELGIRDTDEKVNRRQVFRRLKVEKKIEPHPKNNKLWRFINTEVRLIDFKSGGMRAPLDIKYPFGIEYYFNTYPGNIIVVAGSPDAGKTAFLLNFIKLNQYDFNIYYQSSEMGEDELKNRLVNFRDIALPDWNFTAEERSSNFADVIRPGCVNIIDYMELSGDFYMVAEYLRQIHDKLADGIALVALQKDPKADQGRGGTFGLEKPRLYLNMDRGKTTIRKAKNWTSPEQNPNGLVVNYKIVGGCNFIITNDWHIDET